MRPAFLLTWLAPAALYFMVLAQALDAPAATARIKGVSLPGVRSTRKRRYEVGYFKEEASSRKLQQLLDFFGGEFDCDLSDAEIERVLDADSRTWRIDDAFWADIDEDLQEIVNCSEEGDTLLFDVSETLQPSRSITLPWALTLSAARRDTDLVDGIFPETRRKTTFSCPPDGQTLFFVQTRDALFANLAFEDCSLNAEDSTAIIEVGECDVEDPQGSIQLHHVEFSRNRLNGTVAVSMDEASCSSLEMIDVRFENNTCSGYCGAVLSSQNNLTDIQVRGNTQAGASTVPAIFFSPPASQTTLRDMVAAENDGPIVHVNRGDLQMRDSLFSLNTAGVSSGGETYGAGVYLTGSEADIRRCSFEDGSAPSGSGLLAVRSSVSIRDSSFERNVGVDGGAAVHLLRCRAVDVRECTFAQNLVPVLDGAGILSNATETLSVRRSVFSSNSAGTGAAIYVIDGEIDISESEFENNDADVSAGALYAERAPLTLESTIFQNNSATSYGGAGQIRSSSPTTIRNLTCRGNSASHGGCFRLQGTALELNDSFIEGNSVTEDGGGISAVNASIAHISRCIFLGNSASYGGGVEIWADSSRIEDTIVSNNQASTSGGGCYLYEGVFVLSNATFELNTVEGYGGGLTCGNIGRLTVQNSAFRQNRAEIGGGGSNVIANCLATFSNVTWASNAAVTGCGGGALAEGGFATYRDSIYEGNSGNGGGGACVDSSPGQFTRVVFRTNTVTGFGGGLLVTNSTADADDCFFGANTAAYGGATFLMQTSEVSLRRSRVLGNVASNQGGGVGVGGLSDLQVSDSIFGSNTATDAAGGALVLNSTMSFVNVTMFASSSGGFGGGIASYDGSRLNITDSSFRQLEAPNSGGGFSMVLSILYLTNSTIDACRTNSSGGAIYLDTSVATIRSSNLSNNFATTNGGGLQLSESRLFGDNLTLHRNTADNSGGGVHCEATSFLNLTRSALVQNRGLYGGGVYVVTDTEGSLNECYAYNNSAFVSGGATYTENANLTIRGGRFLENRATYGAALFVFNGRLHVHDAALLNGTATLSGGGVLAGSESFVTIRGTRFVSNTAETGGCIQLEQSYLWALDASFVECQANLDGAAINSNISSSMLCSECTFEDNFAVGKGGAVNIDSHKTQLLAYQFDDCTFSNNRAALGGAFHFVSADSGEDCAVRDARCTFVALRGTHFARNQASSAGGAILAGDLNAIRLTCSHRARGNRQRYLTKEAFESLDVLDTLERICPEWTNNEAAVYGNTLASYARRVKKVIRYENRDFEEEVQGNRYVVRNHVSGTQIPSLYLEVVDAFGQGPARGAGNETIVATMASPDNLFSGSIGVRLDDGAGNFSGVAGYREAGFYDVRVAFSESSIPSFTIVVEIRGCTVGEAIVANGTICQPCNGNTYNFFPERADPGCTSCPDNANCDTVLIHPDAGYWHQTPCSDHIQECLTLRACDEKHREEELRQLGSSVEECQFSEPFIRSYVDAQCRRGYKGPLCGSCEASFGRSRSFRCEPCRNGFSNFMLVLISILVLLVLSAFAIRSSLPVKRRSVRAIDGQKRRGPMPEKEAIPPASPPREETPSPSSTLPSLDMRMVEMLRRGHDPSEFLESRRQQPSPSPSPSPQPPKQTEQDAQLAKWKAVEIFKITINYLQVIAVAISINVDWTAALIGVFETAEFLGGVTSEAATRSVDCLISEDSAIPRSAVRTVVSILVPMLVTGVYFVVWAIALHRVSETLSYLAKRCVLSFMAVSYLSYIAITKTAVNALSCIEVYDSLELGSEAKTRYWAVDTSLRCYEGSHAVLAGLIGWPVLIIFSLGFPAAVAAILVLERKRHDMESEWLFEATGFMYRAYQKKYVYWESVIMLRKAILAVVVVFSYALGGNLQGVLGVCVLMLALYFQIVCGPFRSEFAELNEYEGLSLLICSLTFVSGLFFNDDRTSQGARVLLTLFLVFANLGIIVFFAAVFFKAAAEYLRTVLEAEDTDYDPDKGSLHVIQVYFRSRCPGAVDRFFSRILRRRSVPTVSDSNSNA